MDPKGFYDILGISTNATDKEIKEAYRTLVFRYHPDRNRSPSAAEIMKKINEAYEVLSDKDKRLQYDSQGTKNTFRSTYTDKYRYSKYNHPRDQYYNIDDKGLFEILKRIFKYVSENSVVLDQSKVSIKWQLLYSLIPVVNLWAFFRVGRGLMSLVVLTPIFIGSFIGIIAYWQKIPQMQYLFLLINGIALTFLITKWSIEWNKHIDQYGYGGTFNQVDIRWQMLFSVIPFINISAFARIECFGKSVILAIPLYITTSIIHTIISNRLAHIHDNESLLISFALTSPIFVIYMWKWAKKWNKFNKK